MALTFIDLIKAHAQYNSLNTPISYTAFLEYIKEQSGLEEPSEIVTTLIELSELTTKQMIAYKLDMGRPKVVGWHGGYTADVGLPTRNISIAQACRELFEKKLDGSLVQLDSLFENVVEKAKEIQFFQYLLFAINHLLNTMSKLQTENDKLDCAYAIDKLYAKICGELNSSCYLPKAFIDAVNNSMLIYNQQLKAMQTNRRASRNNNFAVVNAFLVVYDAVIQAIPTEQYLLKNSFEAQLKTVFDEVAEYNYLQAGSLVSAITQRLSLEMLECTLQAWYQIQVEVQQRTDYDSVDNAKHTESINLQPMDGNTASQPAIPLWLQCMTDMDRNDRTRNDALETYISQNKLVFTNTTSVRARIK